MDGISIYMSKIIVTVQNSRNNIDLISHIHRVTKLGYSTILGCLDGEKPLGQWPLFGNDHDEIALLLRNLIAIQMTGAGDFCFFELQDDDVFCKQSCRKLMISKSSLGNILDDHEARCRKRDIDTSE
jgi:hypothetical protein